MQEQQPEKVTYPLPFFACSIPIAEPKSCWVDCRYDNTHYYMRTHVIVYSIDQPDRVTKKDRKESPLMHFIIYMVFPQLTVQCQRKKAAPCTMTGGSATCDDKFGYFMPPDSNSVYTYQWNTLKWEELPPSPYRNAGLVIIDGELTAVGGEDESCTTNKLFTLRQGQWVEHYPPMNTACSKATVVSTPDGSHVFVIGGSDKWTTNVELFHVKTRIWYELIYFPPPLTQPSSATICDNQLHVIGHDGDGYACSLQALPSSDEPMTSQSTPRITLTWKQLCYSHESTVATLCGELVIITGDELHQLVDGNWEKVGSLSSGNSRRGCLVVAPSPDKMLVVGGHGEDDTGGDIGVEECIVVPMPPYEV